MRASSRVRKTAGATAAVMAASSVGVSNLSRDANDEVVLLSDQAMGQVHGGDAISVACGLGGGGVAIYRWVAINIAGAETVWSVPLAAAAFCGMWAIDTYIVDPYFIQPWVLSWANDIYAGLEQIGEIDAQFSCSDPSTCTPTYYSGVVENVADWFCGGDGCICNDGATDCYSGMCNDGYCGS